MDSELDLSNVQELAPSLLKSLLRKEVEIKVLCQKSCSGHVQSIDPVSKSFILLKFENNVIPEVIFVPGCSIKHVHIISNKLPDEMEKIIDNFFKKEEVNYTKEELDKRREALCIWLSGNRVPYSVSNALAVEVLQVATIMPPYTVSSIRCKNEVVLDKVIKLLTSAPGLENEENQDHE